MPGHPEFLVSLSKCHWRLIQLRVDRVLSEEVHNFIIDVMNYVLDRSNFFAKSQIGYLFMLPVDLVGFFGLNIS